MTAPASRRCRLNLPLARRMSSALSWLPPQLSPPSHGGRLPRRRGFARRGASRRMMRRPLLPSGRRRSGCGSSHRRSCCAACCARTRRPRVRPRPPSRRGRFRRALRCCCSTPCAVSPSRRPTSCTPCCTGACWTARRPARSGQLRAASSWRAAGPAASRRRRRCTSGRWRVRGCSTRRSIPPWQRTWLARRPAVFHSRCRRHPHWRCFRGTPRRACTSAARGCCRRSWPRQPRRGGRRRRRRRRRRGKRAVRCPPHPSPQPWAARACWARRTCPPRLRRQVQPASWNPVGTSPAAPP